MFLIIAVKKLITGVVTPPPQIIREEETIKIVEVKEIKPADEETLKEVSSSSFGRPGEAQ